MFNSAHFKKLMSDKIEWLSQELLGLRTGRATPSLLDGVSVEVYGSRMKLAQVANLTVEDARTLYVNPWDKGELKAIEKAITVADLGISVGSDDKGIRVSFPELTLERRQQLVKLVRSKLEEARVQVKGIRSKAIDEIESDGVSEDEEKKLKSDVQKNVDDANKALEDVAKKKEEDLMK